MEDILHSNQYFVTTRGGAVEYAIKNVSIPTIYKHLKTDSVFILSIG